MVRAWNDTAPSPSTGQIIGGIAFIIGWAFLHVVLFYAFAFSGILMDAFLIFLKSFLFPGASMGGGSAHEALAWEGFLRAGLILAGVAGIPGGLAKFIPSRRTLLKRGFWLLLLAGVVFELYALYILISNAFTLPT